ncbi:MAG: class I SAM-dependent methyltransferase [Candidatus Hermodarchaeota archaeon]
MSNWDDIYKKELRGIWYPILGIIRFTARYLKRKIGIELYETKKETKRIIDLGCGNGNHVVFFAEQGFDVSGIDISEEAIEIARAWLNMRDLKADLQAGDIENIPCPDQSFDVVISHAVLDHIPFEKAKKVMEEIKRILVPGGYVCISLRSIEDCEFGRGKEVEYHTFVLEEGYEKGVIQHYFDFQEIKELFTDFKIFDLELHEEKFPSVFTVDKSFIQSSGKTKEYIDVSKPVELNLKYSRWFVSAEKM